jgi:hypothetical protein
MLLVQLRIVAVLVGRGGYIAVVIALLALVGQAVAATAMPCPMLQEASVDEHAGMHDHAGHQSAAASEQAPASCCDLPGSCSMAGCTAVSAALPVTGIKALLSPLTIVAHTTSGLSNSHSRSVYRPPIFR